MKTICKFSIRYLRNPSAKNIVIRTIVDKSSLSYKKMYNKSQNLLKRY